VTDATTRRKAENALGNVDVILRSARPVLRCVACALILLTTGAPNIAGCRSDQHPSEPRRPENSEHGLVAAPEAERFARADALLAEASAQLDRGEPATGAHAAAAAAIEVARLGGPARYLSKARSVLERASAQRGPEACDSALQLSRLFSTLLRDLSAAQAVAERASSVHREDPGSAACASELRRIAEVLSQHRAAAAQAEGTAPGQADTLTDNAIVDFAGAREERAEGVKLEEIAVYGRGISGEARGAEARVVLHFDDVAIYKRSEQPAGQGAGRRLFLDLDEVTLGPRIEPLLNVGAAGLSRVRVAELGGGQARVTFDIEPTTAYRLFFLSDPYRVVMDFRDASQRAASGRSAAYTIVIDPGHGGDATGAKGPNGIREAEVALSLALRVRKALARSLPFARIVMTRERDVDVTLEARSALANALDADLFVSIHLNASESSQDKGGVSTYVLDSTTDAAALRLAAQENGTDEAGVSALQLVLASLYRKDQVDHSRGLAEDVQSALLRSGRKVYPDLNDRGVKRALFYVLVGARMPAILVEASFITRPEEALLLATDHYRQALADGIAQGIERYVTRSRAAATPRAAASP
jgi:N-acetylmuramoyl-L-alanine amidase